MTPDTSAEAVDGYADWHEREAHTLRLHRSDSPVMPELAEMHEETAATLRALTAERDRLAAEVASLRLTLGGRTFDASVPEPNGCPLPGACSTVAEIVRGREMQAAWLRVIQAENTCAVTGSPCHAKRCGCKGEQDMLIEEARAALTGGTDNG